MKARALQSLAVCLALWATASVAEPVPFTRVLAVAQQSPDTIFIHPLGIYFVLDPDQNMGWIVDRDGKFEVLVSLTEEAGYADVAVDGEVVENFPLQEKIEWQVLPSIAPELPAVRPLFQKIPSAKLTKAVGKFLPAGSQFDGYFSVRTPEDLTYIWRPDSTAKGIIVQDLTTGSVDFVEISTLSDALAEKE